MAKAKLEQPSKHFDYKLKYKGLKSVFYEDKGGRTPVSGHLLKVKDVLADPYYVFIPGSNDRLKPGVYGYGWELPRSELTGWEKETRKLEEKLERLEEKRDEAGLLGKLWNKLYRDKRVDKLEKELRGRRLASLSGVVYVLPSDTWGLPDSKLKHSLKGFYGRLRKAYDFLRREERKPTVYEKELKAHAEDIATRLDSYRINAVENFFFGTPRAAYTDVSAPQAGDGGSS